MEWSELYFKTSVTQPNAKLKSSIIPALRANVGDSAYTPHKVADHSLTRLQSKFRGENLLRRCGRPTTAAAAVAECLPGGLTLINDVHFSKELRRNS